ncbi:MAG TPA: hypothetical protein VGA72_14595 [Anaerolineales bacterium]
MSTVGDYAELLFNGTKSILTFTKHADRGSIDVYVDGSKITMINANAASPLRQQIYISPALAAGNHAVSRIC